MSDPSVPPPLPSPAPGPPPVPPGFAAPVAYAAPYAPPYVMPRGIASPPPPVVRRSPMLGLIALFAAIAAAVVAPIVAVVAGFDIGLGVGRELTLLPTSADWDWSILSPVRDWVLVGEIAFWAGTVLGLWALVQGIIAIVKNAGRVPGIIAVVLAALGPVAFGLAVQISLTAGYAAGSSIGG